MNEIPTILAIESSCDDTSVAILRADNVLSNVTATQVDHAKYGGVIPELASRKHLINILPVVMEALEKAKIDIQDIDAVAFTVGPGLMGSLIVGVSFAKSLALSLNIPIITVNHMQAHILAHFIDNPKPDFPFLCMTVSGGHTQIVQVNSYLEMEILGQTIDDAAGEAFDKTGKLLNLGYPAGPLIDKEAKKGQPIFQFAKPRIENLDMSFSGLKTSILYFLKKQIKENPNFITENLADICCSVQTSIVNILMDKLAKAVKQTGIKHIGIAGGVSANSQLRDSFLALGKTNNWNTYIPSFEYCTDNAAMIGIVAYHKYLAQDFADWDVAPQTRLKVNQV